MTSTRPDFEPPRRYLRHQTDVPLEVRVVAAPAPVRRGSRVTHSHDVGEGGLSFVSDDDIPVGTGLVIRIPVVQPPFEARTRVAWTRPAGARYLVGVEFLDAEDSFRARMVEQVCAIDAYRRRVEAEEGRVLTRDEAAAEWISRNADRFPPP
jgi:hypothetical protein